MKRLWMILWMVCHTAWASPELRHTQGMQGLELTGGKTAIGYHVNGAYSAYRSHQWYWKLSLGGAWRQQPKSSYQSFQCMPALVTTLWQGKKVTYLNLLFGVAPIYESHEQRGNNHKGWNMALKLGPELELFLSEHLVLLVSLLPSYYCLQNPYGRWGYEGALGLKVTF